MNGGPQREQDRELISTLVTNIQGYSVHDGPGIRTTVFLKGCPLSCRWCANPECISPEPQLAFTESLCTRCAACATVCRQEAIGFDASGLPRIDRARCIGCGECALICTYKALVIQGKRMSVEEVFEAVRSDRLFYEASGGGVTVTGGEPLMQPEFVRALFEKLRDDAIHTCIETSGCVASSALLEVLPVTDYVLFDLKLLDSAAHRKFTGRPNELVLANARLVVDSQKEFLFRMPLIPGVNDSSENIRETADFLRALGKRAARIELMPYHRLGEGKYTSIGRRYRLHGMPPMDSGQVERVKQAFESAGIRCSVSS